MDVNEPLLSVSSVLLVLTGVRKWLWPLLEPYLKSGLTRRMEKWAKDGEPARIPDAPPGTDIFQPVTVPPAPAQRPLPTPSPRARPRPPPEAEDAPPGPSIAMLQHEMELMRLRHALGEVQDTLRDTRGELQAALLREKELQKRLEAQEGYNRKLVTEQERLRRGEGERPYARTTTSSTGHRDPARPELDRLVDAPFAKGPSARSDRLPRLGRPEGHRPVRKADEDEGD